MADELTPLAKKLIETLEQSGEEWLTRREIAARLGRPGVLPPYDVQLLEKLVQDGLVEKQQQSRGVVLFEYTYRLKK